jgi:chemotaxis-related protein WspD
MSASEKAVRLEIDPCWSRIGVRGDKSCPQLPQHSHCSHCPSYRRAGRAILDARSLDEVYGESTLTPAPLAADDTDTPTQAIMTFRLGTEDFALPLAVCREVIEARAIHSLPHRRRGVVLGLANVRGTLLICLSLGAILRVTTKAAGQGATARLLVIEADAGPLAILVDEVCGVHRYRTADLQSAPATLAQGGHRGHAIGVLTLDQRTLGVLDTQRLLQTIDRALT